ncbi:MAG: lytic murein transglycosylase [Myxococcaceae bacterium]|nr:lytic murein transglycosylase [Myxococcaceae bacterium]
MLLGLLLLALDAGAPPAADAGAPRSVDAGPADAGVPDWQLSQKLGKGSALRTELVKELTAPLRRDAGTGEQALTEAEADALLDDPRAQPVYGEKTVSIVAPSMVVKQRKDHLDLMALFLKRERVEAGARFFAERREVLERTRAKTGVDPTVIIAILTWESKLGTITGDFKAFNVFTSQAYFIDEANAVALKRAGEKKVLSPEEQQKRVERIRERAHRNLVVLARQCKGRNIDTLEVKGSWAGALGFPQFMPDSLRWADDGDGDGKIDLFTMDDSIASIGRYLKEHGFAKSRHDAVYGYNHEDAYVQGVLAFSEALTRVTAETMDPFFAPGVFEPALALPDKTPKPPDPEALAALEAKVGPLPKEVRAVWERSDGGAFQVPVGATGHRTLVVFSPKEALDRLGGGLIPKGSKGMLPLGNDGGRVTLFVDTKGELGRGKGALWSIDKADGPVRQAARFEGLTLLEPLKRFAFDVPLFDKVNGLLPIAPGADAGK